MKGSTFITIILITNLAAIVGGCVFIVGLLAIILIVIWLSNLRISSEITTIFGLFLLLILFILTIVSIIGILFIAYKKFNKNVEKKFRGFKIADIDSMGGIEFEEYLRRLLTYRGFNVNLTQTSGDLGVDLIASRDDEIVAIQAKRHNSKISRVAISDAVAGIKYYKCNKAMVITNNYFTPGAITLAQSTGCILIDRDTLAIWVNEFEIPNQ